MHLVRDDAPSGDGEGERARAAEEAALVRLAQRDLRAFEPVYRRYAVPIHRYCFRRLGEREAAADATSQTFARAMAGIDTFRGGSVAAWLFTIARNVVIDAVRYRRPQADLDDTDAAGGLVDPAPRPDDRALETERREALFRALGELTPDQRGVIELRMAGFTGQEIADALGLTVGAVKSSQFRAYARLRTLLAGDDLFGDLS